MHKNAEQAVQTLKESLSHAPGIFDGRAVLLFSGGRDSTAVAASFCIAFPKGQLHLLFIDNGLLSRIDSTKRQFLLLQNLFPETDMVFETMLVSRLMRVAAMQQVEKDLTSGRFSTLLVCVACKLIMNCAAARYARDLGITVIMDGYASRQCDYPEQTEVFKEFIRKMYQERGLFHVSPLYDFLTDRDLVVGTLAEMGVYIAKQEPLCMWADSFSPADPKEILEYTHKTLDVLQEHDPTFHV